MIVNDEVVDWMIMECHFDPDIVETFWAWTNPLSQNLTRTLPMCKKQCKTNPPTRTDLRWSKGLVS